MSVGSTLICLLLLTQQLGGPPGGNEPPKIRLRPYASVQSVSPGQTIDVVWQLDIPRPWHMYHPILLDTGLPTVFKFETPSGVRVGEVRFPTPHYGVQSEIEFLELTGRVLCVAPLTVEKSVQPGPLTVRASVRGLACIEACVPVETSAELSLPITEKPGAAANGEKLKEATEAFPAQISDAPYIKGSRVELAGSTLEFKKAGEIVATIKVEPRHHIQDRNPGIEGLIASRFFVESPEGLDIARPDKQIWPEPKKKASKGVGEAREHEGEIKIRIPMEITDEKFPSGPVALRVLFQYQACTDAGVCYPPEFAETVLRFEARTPTPAASGAAVASDTPAAESGEKGDQPAPASQSTTAAPPAQRKAAAGVSFWAAIFFALLGGLLMNVMPCVLPVISIKIVSFIEQSGDHPERVFRLGLAFAAGVLAWFGIMAAIAGLGSVQLRSQFQNPLQNVSVVMALATIVFVMALNMFGVFEITLPGSTAGRLDAAQRKEGYGGAFAKGLLATVLGTACTAPFVGSAFAYALTQPIAVTFLVFMVAGVGMSLPYVLLAANPAWLRFVPKPGKWMVTFKEGMGFILLGTAIWLSWVMRKQIGADGVILFSGFLAFVGLGVWVGGKANPLAGAGVWVRNWAAAIAVCIAGWFITMKWLYDSERALPHALISTLNPAELDALAKKVQAADWKRIPWVPYQPGLAAALAERGYSVYVDYTADWCLNCKVNLKTSLEVDQVRAEMKSLGIIPIEADFTANDPGMRRDIDAVGRPSVPVNLVYPANKPNDFILLPEILTPGIVLDAIRTAGASPAFKKYAATSGG
ncbi:MAG: hypothetical protein HZB38_18405 [Planctomycetes bacterium]|nr:hypothetical protein [Planctomycetota bacterium]